MNKINRNHVLIIFLFLAISFLPNKVQAIIRVDGPDVVITKCPSGAGDTWAGFVRGAQENEWGICQELDACSYKYYLPENIDSVEWYLNGQYKGSLGADTRQEGESCDCKDKN